MIFQDSSGSIYFYKKSVKKKKNNIDKIIKVFISRIKGEKSLGKIFWIYLLAVLVGAFILCIPGVVIGKHETLDTHGNVVLIDFSWKYLYSLFNASSAFSDTGLSVPCAGTDYSFWGQFVIAFLIQIGGFGVITIKIMFLSMIGKKIGLRDILLAQEERGDSRKGSTISIIKGSLTFLMVFELISALFLFIAFYLYSPQDTGDGNFNNPYHNFSLSLWFGIFHSISAINNAGFDIIGQTSLQPYNHNYFIQTIFLLEFIVGGIGFPTFYDITKSKFFTNKDSRLSLFTKLNLTTYFLVSVVGVSSVCAIEFGYGSNSEIISNSSSTGTAFMDIFFNTMSTRNAGFSTVNLGEFSYGSKIIQSIMMFVGSAPASTAGGIRTTTFAIVILYLVALSRGRKNVIAFKKTVPSRTVSQSFSVFSVGIILVFFGVILTSAFNKNIPAIDIFYTVSSAFGTTGLSTISFYEMYNLGAIPLISIILIMFIGQMGISATLLFWSDRHDKKSFSYPEENVGVG